MPALLAAPWQRMWGRVSWDAQGAGPDTRPAARLLPAAARRCVQCCNRRKLKPQPERAQLISGGQGEVGWGWGVCLARVERRCVATWLYLQRPRCCACHRSSPLHNCAPTPLPSRAPQSAPAGAGADPPPTWAQRCRRPAFLYHALLVALALTVAGLGTWGMVESINATDTTFSHLWGIVRDVASRVGAAGVLRGKRREGTRQGRTAGRRGRRGAGLGRLPHTSCKEATPLCSPRVLPAGEKRHRRLRDVARAAGRGAEQPDGRHRGGQG